MTVIVDHRQRRLAILERAFALFAEEGYRGVTYQKIADRCGIARTAIYKYFRNKEEIFLYAVRLAAGNLNTLIERVLRQTDAAPLEKLIRILHITVRLLAENRIFLTVILDYILTQKQSGKDVRRQVRCHTFGMKNLFVRLLREAADSGEINLCNTNIRHTEMISHHLYGMLESFVLNLTVTDILDTKDYIGLIDSYIRQLK
ncbi:MAG: TetR/AcrR family transcriptional regulator [Planctomycetaceae bacterium]|jgi:AcrR family transcriptional regulator|nr:TetR/AcrR family transcriptional regulator [Planctomycetaceae bacterium]